MDLEDGINHEDIKMIMKLLDKGMHGFFRTVNLDL